MACAASKNIKKSIYIIITTVLIFDNRFFLYTTSVKTVSTIFFFFLYVLRAVFTLYSQILRDFRTLLCRESAPFPIYSKACSLCDFDILSNRPNSPTVRVHREICESTRCPEEERLRRKKRIHKFEIRSRNIRSFD